MLERGFKTWCEKTAEHYRAKLALAPTAPLKPRLLADHLKVRVWFPKDIPGIEPSDLEQLLVRDPGAWSAATVSLDSMNAIILNSAHSIGRQANDLMHELAHIIRGHKPTRVDVSEDGHLILHTYDDGQEEEADILASCLLLPRVALLAMKQKRVPINDASIEYGVSEKLLRMRLDRSGVNIQFERAQRKRSGT